MSHGQLLLHPVLPTSGIAVEQLDRLLTEIGFAGETIPGLSEGRYVGENFLNLLTFMGCSPHIRLEPDDDSDTGYCHIAITRLPQPVIRHSENARPPRCTACGKPVAKSWESIGISESEIECPFCSQCHADSQSLRWKNDAGYGTLFVEIRNIYPGRHNRCHH